MRRSVLVSLTVVLAVAGWGAAPAGAQTPDPEALRKEVAQLRQDIEALRQAYGEKLAALEAQLAALSAALSSPQPPPVEPAQPAAPVSGPSGISAAASKVFNPDIAVIGNFLAAGGNTPADRLPAFEMRESEVSLQSVVDPYARADVFLAFGEAGVDLEEGFITFPTIPGGLLVKVGKMRSAFGKMNTLHTHMVPWPDRPLVTRNLVAGEEGLSDAGVSVARLIPNPWLFLEATGQVFRGDAGEVFQSNRASDLSYLGRLRAYQDITESSNIDLGASFALGHNGAGVVDDVDAGRFTTRLFGVDATYRWRPLQRSIYRSFIARSEFVWSRRQQLDGVQPAFGFYVSGDYQLARRWYAGVRFDRSGRADDARLVDTGQALVLTFAPSEFSQFRTMYRRTRYADAGTANEFLVQLQFAIGAHAAHPF